MQEFKVKSASSDRSYLVIQLDTGAWRCDCPHWMYRLRKQGSACKHIVKMQKWQEVHDRLEKLDWSFDLMEEAGDEDLY